MVLFLRKWGGGVLLERSFPEQYLMKIIQQYDFIAIKHIEIVGISVQAGFFF